MGVEFVRGKVASIHEDGDHNPIVKVEVTEDGHIVKRTFDMVVLSLGMIPANSGSQFGVNSSSDGFISIPAINTDPSSTSKPGIFVTGTAGGPMDIVDSIVTSSAAASEASSYIREKTGMEIVQEEMSNA